MKRIPLILFLAGWCPTAGFAETVRLDDLNLAPIIQGWGKHFSVTTSVTLAQVWVTLGVTVPQ
jgi:hypothetical protein